MIFISIPTSEHLAEIEFWLKREEETLKSGFYCNWDTIKKSFEKQRLFAFSLDGKIIGFICWNTYASPYVDIDIMEIHPFFRGKGYGQQFYQLAEEYFARNEFLVIKLFCEPTESEGFWKKRNYTKFPSRGYSESSLTYYKPLIEINQPSPYAGNNKLELWNTEPYQIKYHKPTWMWNIGANTAPIIQPVNGDWSLRLTKSGVIVNEDKVKYFDNKNDILIGPFLIIDTTHYFY